MEQKETDALDLIDEILDIIFHIFLYLVNMFGGSGIAFIAWKSIAYELNLPPFAYGTFLLIFLAINMLAYTIKFIFYPHN